MDKNKSQQWNFSMEAIPILFHSSTTSFMKYLEKDGKKFLDFYWNHVGDRLDEKKREIPAGLAYEIEVIDEKTKLVIITLPQPKENGDAYFLGLVARPEKRFSWVRLPNSTIFALIRDDKCGQTHLTSFGVLTPRALFRPRGIGLPPTNFDFKRIVKNKLESKQKKRSK
jgi:hypothetical protein